LNERAGLASLRLIAELSEDGIAELASSKDKAQRAFASGQVGFYMGWLSEVGALERAQKDAKRSFAIGVAPLPQLQQDTPWVLTRGDMFGITGGPEERARSAWFFVRWVTAPTQNARWVRATDSLPMRASALTFLPPASTSRARYRQLLSAFESAEPRLMPVPAHPFADALEQSVADLWLQATQPKPDVRAVLDGMAARLNQLLAIRP
jgi:ABC-type glycerol-3-phosphate transport system substrate-binding protein